MVLFFFQCIPTAVKYNFDVNMQYVFLVSGIQHRFRLRLRLLLPLRGVWHRRAVGQHLGESSAGRSLLHGWGHGHDASGRGPLCHHGVVHRGGVAGAVRGAEAMVR